MNETLNVKPFTGHPAYRSTALPPSGRPTLLRTREFPNVLVPLLYASRTAIGEAMKEGRLL